MVALSDIMRKSSDNKFSFIDFQKNFFSDASTWSLVISNLIMIIFALVERWNILTIMWIYWIQSVIIGFSNFIRILMLKDFSTKGISINGKPVEPTKKFKFYTAFFFLGHYGFFHLGYAIFLFSDVFRGVSSSTIDCSYIFLTSVIFFGNHIFSLFYNRERDRKKQNIGRMMFFPYARILPMHLTLIFGYFLGGGAIVLFLLLKTCADVIMHRIEHSEKQSFQLKSSLLP